MSRAEEKKRKKEKPGSTWRGVVPGGDNKVNDFVISLGIKVPGGRDRKGA